MERQNNSSYPGSNGRGYYSHNYQQQQQHRQQQQRPHQPRYNPATTAATSAFPSEDVELGRPSTPYHIVEILVNSSGRAILPGINVRAGFVPWSISSENKCELIEPYNQGQNQLHLNLTANCY